MLANLCNELAQLNPSLDGCVAVVESLAPGVRVTLKTNLPAAGILGKEGGEPLNVLLLTTTRTSDFTSELTRACNGVIIDCATWTILSMLSPVCTTFKRAEAAKNLAKYTLYLAEDGTTVSLYYKNGIRLATNNGFDVSHLTRFGETTWAEALCELLTGKPKLEGAQLVIDNFFPTEESRKVCYVLGVRHHHFCLLESDPQRVWFLTAYNLTTCEEVDCPVPLPRQEQVQISVKECLSLCNNALSTYKQSGRKTHFYGVVFRGKDLPDDCKKYSNMFLESSLMQYIRKTIYDFGDVPVLPKPITPYQRCIFVTLRGLLAPPAKRIDFMAWFPNLPHANFSAFIRLLSISTLIIMGGGKPVNKDEVVLKMASINSAHLLRHIDYRDENAESLVADYFYQTQHMKTYYAYAINRGLPNVELPPQSTRPVQQNNRPKKKRTPK